MKTAEERAEVLVDAFELYKNATKEQKIAAMLKALKDQHAATRELCANNIYDADHDCETATGDNAIRFDRAWEIIMNTEMG